MKLSVWRHLRVIEGSRSRVLNAAPEHDGERCIWISEMVGVHPDRARKLLGRGVQTVVLDLLGGFRADALGVAHGMVEGGGELVMLTGPWVGPWEGLRVWPFLSGGRRAEARLDRPLGAGETVDADPMGDQAALVRRILERWEVGDRRPTVLTADRGRGKSAAVGLAVAGRGAVVTGPSPGAVAEVLRFAPDARWSRPDRVSGEALVVVDEAAALPLPLLRSIRARNPESLQIFSTTVHGYEGTGRGFEVRFASGLDAARETLRHPIRWAAGDPLERWVFDVLALDARPERIEAGTTRVHRLSKDELASDEGLLRQVFGLLVEAHYRTTPADLQRLLDAPNLTVHAAMRQSTVVGVTIVAREGDLDSEQLGALAKGVRLRGHALPDTLFHHSGSDAGRLPILRSVRIAVQQEHRRRGIARAMVEHVEKEHDAAIYGTLFGARPEVLSFRRSLGYRLVRIGLSRGSRSGEPTAVMLKPATEEAEDIVHRLQQHLARDFDVVRRQLHDVEPALVEAFAVGLPAPMPWTNDDLQEQMAAFAAGRPFEAVAPALLELDRRGELRVSEVARERLHGLVSGSLGWGDLVGDYPSVRAAMKALRAEWLRGCRS